jgi:hypothetical protein
MVGRRTLLHEQGSILLEKPVAARTTLLHGAVNRQIYCLIFSVNNT